MELPSDVRRLFDRALQAARGLSPHHVREEQEAFRALLDQAMLAAGFPVHDAKTPAGHLLSWQQRTIFRASSLTPLQRAAAVFLAGQPTLPTQRHPLPGAPWAIRRWLGLDPKGVLFEEGNDGRTPYEALRGFPTHYEAFHAYLETLPPRDRLQALTDWSLLTEDCALTPTNELHALLPEIDESLGAWALERAQWLLRHHPDPRNAESVSRAPLPKHVFIAVSPPIYLALMRAGLSNVPNFDALLPLGQWCAVTPSWCAQTQRDLVHAISEERREAALLYAVNNLIFNDESVTALQRHLPAFPYPAVASYILQHAHQARHPQHALDAVRAVGETSPAIAALCRAHMKALGDIPKLRAMSLTPVSALGTLTQAQQDQLAAHASSWGLSVEALLAALPGTERELNLVLIDDEEGPALAAWLNEGDEGPIFRAATTEEVAWMSQDGLAECENGALFAALREALRPRHLDALRAANGPGIANGPGHANGPGNAGPWAAYRKAVAHSDAHDDEPRETTVVSGDGTLAPLIVPHEEDEPF